ncbi:SRR1-like protein [Galdieria sulphuraria]|nr:SRR1-like protein [Galdieria sulphuraria]
MNCEKDSASCWTVVMRQRRRKNVSSSRHSESSRGSAIMCPSDANFKKNDRDSTELRLQEVDHDTVSSPFGNLERSDYSDVVRELLCEVSRLKEQVQDSKWWHELLKLLFSHGLVCLDGPSNVFGYWKSSVEQQAYSRKRVGKLICYGLGSFENSAISRYQLALAKLLQECCVANVKTDHCGSWYSCSSVYDPVMSAVDIELCTLLGFVQAEPTFQLSSKHVSCERLKPISVVMEEDFCCIKLLFWETAFHFTKRLGAWLTWILIWVLQVGG